MGGAPQVGTSWFKKALAPMIKISHDANSPGTIWSGVEAERAFAAGDMNSKDAGTSLRVGFRNQSKLPLLLSWISEEGKCHHFYTLKPAEILEGPVTALDHIENTCLGHSFCVAFVGDDEEQVRSKGSINAKYVVGGYRPDSYLNSEEAVSNYAHLVTIYQKPAKRKIVCCSPLAEISQGGNLRGHQADDEIGNSFDDLCWVVEAKETQVDDKQINTSTTKTYEKSTLGGWPVFLEPNWNDGDEELTKRLSEDLAFAASCLPKHAREFLRENTPVYINREFQWGPISFPVTGRGMCFHPEKEWLEENFMHTEKCECVEVYKAKEYWDDCTHWGCGGVFIHEFSHAYHHKCMKDGYDNKEIKECFELAMKERLYDWVKVHGKQGPMSKSYACTNCMEYFAELSAAFLGQPDMHSEEEFNKWYPFNRRQIKEHDPRAYELLKRVWKVEE